MLPSTPAINNALFSYDDYKVGYLGDDEAPSSNKRTAHYAIHQIVNNSIPDNDFTRRKKTYLRKRSDDRNFWTRSIDTPTPTRHILRQESSEHTIDAMQESTEGLSS